MPRPGGTSWRGGASRVCWPRDRTCAEDTAAPRPVPAMPPGAGIGAGGPPVFAVMSFPSVTTRFGRALYELGAQNLQGRGLAQPRDPWPWSRGGQGLVHLASLLVLFCGLEDVLV